MSTNMHSAWKGQKRTSVSSTQKFHKNVIRRDFPGGPVVKNRPCNAGGVGLSPGQGTTIPQVREQINLHTVTRKSMHLDEGSSMKQWKNSHVTIKTRCSQLNKNKWLSNS